MSVLACWVEDPNGEYFKKHLARVPDYFWVAEDGMKVQVKSLYIVLTYVYALSQGFLEFQAFMMQSFGSQLWDTSLAIQALLACNLSDEIADVLKKGHDFIQKSQVTSL